MDAEGLARAKLSLEGLSIGDAFGERFFVHPDALIPALEQRRVPSAPPWKWTDDTAMAISVVEVLAGCGEVNQDALAAAFLRRYAADPRRGYGGGAHQFFQNLAVGGDWFAESHSLFAGTGSFGNGGAMRVAPLGAYFAGRPHAYVAEQARLSAEVTHAHPEGQAGAIAIALVTALLTDDPTISAENLFDIVLEFTPSGRTHQNIVNARHTCLDQTAVQASVNLGNGSGVSAMDTVGFCIWCALRWRANFEEAMWGTVSALGDRDTTCAIVGGILAPSLGLGAIPLGWREARESLDALG